MKVTVDPDRCQGHGVCYMTASAVFELSEDDGHAYVPLGEVPAHLEADARRGAQSCPELAITVGAPATSTSAPT